jgi:hypothetical protein
VLASLVAFLAVASREGWGLVYGFGGPVVIALMLVELYRVSRRHRWNALGSASLMVGLVLLALIACGYVWLFWNFELNLVWASGGA